MIGRELRFHEDLGVPYTATVVAVDESQVPPVLTVEVKYEGCVVTTQITEDDAHLL